MTEAGWDKSLLFLIISLVELFVFFKLCPCITLRKIKIEFLAACGAQTGRGREDGRETHRAAQERKDENGSVWWGCTWRELGAFAKFGGPSQRDFLMDSMEVVKK